MLLFVEHSLFAAMDKISFDYSIKNIPFSSSDNYRKRLIQKTEHLIKRMRWKAFFYLQPEVTTSLKETYGFKSRKVPPNIDELKDFEDKMLKLIQDIRFEKNNKCSFQRQLRNDINTLGKDEKIYTKADKTTNYYKLPKDKYCELMTNNITNTYKKAEENIESTINNEAKAIAQKLKLDDRIEKMANKESFITLKDHKPNFLNNPTCRLINPAKSEIGYISKKILDRINNNIIKMNNTNLWKNTTSVINWFRDLKDKENTSFICFDVVEFYPSITESTLKKALDYASNFDNITQDEREIILHAKKSLLFGNGKTWQKKNSEKPFDVTMGSYDGAETCELVGCLILSKLNQKYDSHIGLYRDDGLAAFNKTPQAIERIKKDICSEFRKYDLKITIEANKKIIDFLDVTLNLTDNSYKPYNKPNNIPVYVHCKSNHPQSILKNLPMNINKRLSEISSNEEIFKEAVPIYQKALADSGYHHRLTFDNNSDKSTSNNNRNRSRNITWYNPPYESQVKTKVGKEFLHIIKTSFYKGHPLQKIFNANTIKLSYSCMPNMKNIIDGHNKGIINGPRDNALEPGCNCRTRNTCPLDGNCLVRNVVYQATVTAENTAETYVGLTETTFKTRFNNHKTSFNNERYKTSTELSKYIWSLKQQDKQYTIKWAMLKQATPYTNNSKTCQLCICEKFYIICKPEIATLNKRNELAGTCRHKNKFLLKSK